MRRRGLNQAERSAYYGRILNGGDKIDHVAVYGKKAETAWEREQKESRLCNASK